jgi:hypothetical protein
MHGLEEVSRALKKYEQAVPNPCCHSGHAMHNIAHMHRRVPFRAAFFHPHASAGSEQQIPADMCTSGAEAYVGSVV